MISFLDSDRKIVNHLDDRTYTLQQINKISNSEEQHKRIAAICNEPSVFKYLFAERFPDGVYPVSAARDWVDWGTDGWQQGTHFTYVVIDENNLAVAACDIKSSNVNAAEIGYWSSSQHRGIMTNSVGAMLQLARDAGFNEFFAEVHTDNIKSQAVLKRLGFKTSSVPSNEKHHSTWNLNAAI